MFYFNTFNKYVFPFYEVEADMALYLSKNSNC